LLHAIDVAEGERIVNRQAGQDDVWAGDFPFEGDINGIRAFLKAVPEESDRGPFGHYRITRRADGQAIGGIGFKGRPLDGRVEVGYGLVPSARGHGYAAEALTALLAVAAEHGVSRVLAATDNDNIPSQRTLERAGFRPASRHGDLRHYEVLLAASPG
jgi:RimJ/RimL family protein N-acetyltransferase